MKKNIFLGALPMGATPDELMSGEMTADQSPSGSRYVNYYPLEMKDNVISSGAGTGTGTGAGQGTGSGADGSSGAGSGDIVATDSDGNVIDSGTNGGSGDNNDVTTGGKSAISIPLVIGAAALIYFLYLRKKK
jgi:hypothetical protein